MKVSFALGQEPQARQTMDRPDNLHRVCQSRRVQDWVVGTCFLRPLMTFLGLSQCRFGGDHGFWLHRTPQVTLYEFTAYGIGHRLCQRECTPHGGPTRQRMGPSCHRSLRTARNSSAFFDLFEPKMVTIECFSSTLYVEDILGAFVPRELTNQSI